MTLVTLDALAQEARSSLERGYAQHALELARHVLSRYPRALEAYRLMGRACTELGQWHEAEDLYKRVLGVDPEDWQAYVGLGTVYRNRGSPAEATWHFERALELDRSHPEVEATLLSLYREREGRELEGAPLTRAALARIYLRGRLLSYAIAELRSLLEEDPERLDLMVALAEGLWRGGQSAEAAAVCQDLLERLPNCLKANLILGQLWRQAGLEREAEDLFRRARDVDPTHRRAVEILGAEAGLAVQEAPLAPPQWRLEDRIPGEPRPGRQSGDWPHSAPADARPEPPGSEASAAVWPDLEASEGASPGPGAGPPGRASRPAPGEPRAPGPEAMRLSPPQSAGHGGGASSGVAAPRPTRGYAAQPDAGAWPDLGPAPPEEVRRPAWPERDPDPGPGGHSPEVASPVTWPDLESGPRAAAGTVWPDLGGHDPTAPSERPGQDEPAPWDEPASWGDGPVSPGLGPAAPDDLEPPSRTGGQPAPRPRSAAVGRLEERVASEPADAAARLELARALLGEGLVQEALDHYHALLHGPQPPLEAIIADLDGLGRRGGLEARRLMGDAFMRQGRLEEALRQYPSS